MIIGLTGNPKVGKGEVSRILQSNYGFEILDTKEVLRKIASEITGFNAELFKKQQWKEYKYQGHECRYIMGEVGYTLERIFGDDFLLRRMLKHIDPSKNYVIDALRMKQAVVLKTSLPQSFVIEITSERGTLDYSFDEYDKSLIDYSVTNNGTLLDLSYTLEVLIKRLEEN